MMTAGSPAFYCTLTYLIFSIEAVLELGINIRDISLFCVLAN